MEYDITFAKRVVHCDSWSEYYCQENIEEYEGPNFTEKKFAHSIIITDSFGNPWVVIEGRNYVTTETCQTFARQSSTKPQRIWKSYIAAHYQTDHKHKHIKFDSYYYNFSFLFAETQVARGYQSIRTWNLVFDHQNLEEGKADIKLRVTENVVEGEKVEGKYNKWDRSYPRNPEGQVLLECIKKLISCNNLIHFSRDVFVVISQAQGGHSQLFITSFEIGEVLLANPPNTSYIANCL